MMTRPQAEALATFVARIRPDWDQPGILAAIQKAQNLANPAAIGRALCALAENRELITPALLSQKGRHWSQDGQAVGPNASHDVHCPEHPLSVHPCPQCAAKRTPPPLDDPEYAAMKADLKARQVRQRAVEKRLADFEGAEK